MRPGLLVGLPMGTRPGAGDPRALVDIARRLEDAGADGVIVSDHVLIGARTDRYAVGRLPVPARGSVARTAHGALRHRHRDGTDQADDRHPHRPAAPGAVAGQDGGHPRPAVGWPLRARGRHRLAGRGVRGAGARPSGEGTDAHRHDRRLPRALARRAGELRVLDGVVRPRVVRAPPDRRRRAARAVLGDAAARNVRRIVELGDGWIPIMGATLEDVRDRRRHAPRPRSTVPAVRRRSCAYGCRCASCGATSRPPSAASMRPSPPAPLTSPCHGPPSATTVSVSSRRCGHHDEPSRRQRTARVNRCSCGPLLSNDGGGERLAASSTINERRRWTSSTRRPEPRLGPAGARARRPVVGRPDRAG